ncbi:MAG TPA: hypothetical protein VKP88_05830 [Candidatus Paceibacterota bacterium]|nr:hypothetical protein [Candidatus Paceibacterota bacterium]
MATLKKVLDWLLTINLIIITGVCIYLWWSGRIQIDVSPQSLTVPVAADPVIANLFKTTLRSEVDRQLGVPENGYTPQMFIAAFPGLTTTDFEDVEASVGKYVVVEGQLVHVMPPGVPRHSAVDAVTSRGLDTLLRNLAQRGQIDLAEDGTLTDVMEMVSPR